MTVVRVLLLLVTWQAIAADQPSPWNFEADRVRSYGCRVEQVDVHIAGTNQGHDEWQAEAWVRYLGNTSNQDDWGHTISRREATVKGRHTALKDCSAWQDEAEKRVHSAQKGKR